MMVNKPELLCVYSRDLLNYGRHLRFFLTLKSLRFGGLFWFAFFIEMATHSHLMPFFCNSKLYLSTKIYRIN